MLIRTKLYYGLSFNYLSINGLADIYFILITTMFLNFL